ncbi:UNVERIFIED_CONTAM: Acylamino-acid-releasing enzyme [Sesamum angustifolium]|uniref:acylaminoacyl-peptidase n=1 Tax=Sesamum angustifolium TaxID=2727405 RepID=A0AAW2NYG7_9LAMI
MDDAGGSPQKQIPVGLDAATQEEYASVSKLLQEFMDISTIDKAWTFKSVTDNVSRAMFVTSQPNLLSNKRRKSILSSHILQKSNNSVSFHWAPFPIEMTGVSTMVPSPSGSKLLVIRNSEGDSPTHFEVWDPSQVKKEFAIPRSTMDLCIRMDDETVIAYVAEEPDAPKPTFTGLVIKRRAIQIRIVVAGRVKVIGKKTGEKLMLGKGSRLSLLLTLAGVGRKLSVGQVVWAPSIEGQQYLVFVGWPSDTRKLGIKYCYNRPCALYAVKAPLFKSEASLTKSNEAEDSLIIKLTQSISSAFFPCFSPDGKFLVFLSAKSSVDSGAHSATESLHKVEWPSDGKLAASLKIIDVVLSLLASLQFDIMKIPVRNVSENLTKEVLWDLVRKRCSLFQEKLGLRYLFCSSHGIHIYEQNSLFGNLVRYLKGYYVLLLLTQDVSDVLTAIDHVIDQGLADPSKIAVLGGSHGGFLTTHLIGQAPEKVAVAATRNPVCNLSLMVGTTDIPDWCYFEVYGSEGKSIFTETPSAEHLALFYSKSPISHISKYARALKEKGVETKVIVFPHDVHGIDRPQSDFESFLNVAVWFKKYCR